MGLRLILETRSARPTMIPAWGPPSNLSPLNVTRSAPAAKVSAGVGSCGKPNRRRSTNAPLPRSTIKGTLRARHTAAISASPAVAVNPSMAKLLGCTRITTPVLSLIAATKSARWVRFVVPISRSLTPARAITSGIRNEPPISINSPREMGTSLRKAKLFRTKRTAAALLLTTVAASAPDQDRFRPHVAPEFDTAAARRDSGPKPAHDVPWFG